MSTVLTPTKAAQTDLLAWQDVAAAAYVEGSALDVSAMFAAAICIKIGRQTATAFTAGSPNIRIQGSIKTTGLTEWTDLWVYQPGVGVATIAKTTTNGAITANDATFVLTSGTNIVASDFLFLGHTTLTAKYELIRVKSISSNTVTPVHNVVNAHDTGANVTEQAEEAVGIIDLSGIMRLRAVADNIGSGQGIYVEVGLTALTAVAGT